MWRPSEVAREALANLRWTHATVVAVTVLGFASLVAAEADTVTRALAEEEGFRRAGGYVLLAETARDGIDIAACVRLARVDGVVAAGAERVAAAETAEYLRPASAPDARIPVTEATVGALAVWAPGSTLLPGSGAAVGGALADELGLDPGRPLVDRTGRSYPVLAVLPPDARHGEAARHVIRLIPPVGTATRCWVELEPGAFSAGIDVVSAALTPAPAPVRVSAFRPRDELSARPADIVTERPQRALWVVVAGLVALAAWTHLWSRRAEIGMYRTFGLTPLRLWLTVDVETVALVVPAAVAGTLWGLAVTAAGSDPLTGANLRFVLDAAASGLGAALLAAPAGFALLLRSNPLDLVKGR